MDGTREFSLPGREDWAVHIALWQRGGEITDAAVALPARGEVYRTDTVTAPPPRTDGPIRITASASRPPAVLWRLREQLDIQTVRIGSAGAKAMAVVRGDVDAYIHAGGQWEWDSAAPAGVVRAAGLHATRLDGSPLIYNRRDPLPARPADVPCGTGRCAARRDLVGLPRPLAGMDWPSSLWLHAKQRTIWRRP